MCFKPLGTYKVAAHDARHKLADACSCYTSDTHGNSCASTLPDCKHVEQEAMGRQHIKLLTHADIELASLQALLCHTSGDDTTASKELSTIEKHGLWDLFQDHVVRGYETRESKCQAYFAQQVWERALQDDKRLVLELVGNAISNDARNVADERRGEVHLHEHVGDDVEAVVLDLGVDVGVDELPGELLEVVLGLPKHSN